MDSAQSTSALSSPIFSVYAGPTKKPFLVHGAILSISPVLRSIVEGQWKESDERSIKLEEWDEQTVEHVLEWLYLGYYYLDVPIDRLRADGKRKASSPLLETGQEQSQGEPILPGEEGADANKYRRPLTPLAPYHTLSCAGPPEEMTQCAEGSVSEAEELSTGKILLPYARVYMLAQYLQLERLKSDALDRFRYFLLEWEPYPFRRGEIISTVNLARFVYTSTYPSVSSEEPMRKLVSTFVAKKFLFLVGPEVDALMSEGGDLVVDVTEKIRRAWWNDMSRS